MRRKYLLAAALCGIMLLPGCASVGDLDFTSSGVKVSSKIYLTKEEAKATLSEAEKLECKTKKINGKTYYYNPNDTGENMVIKYGESYNQDKGCAFGELIQPEAFSIDVGNLVLRNNERTNRNLYEFEAFCNIKMPNNIIETNGVKVGQREVEFNKCEKSEIYAYTKKGKAMVESDQESPMIYGLGSEGYHNMLNINFADNLGVKEVKMNGTAAKDISTFSLSGENDEGVIEKLGVKENVEAGFSTFCNYFFDGRGHNLVRQGKNTFEVYDYNDNCKSVAFYYDSKSPLISSLKSERTYRKGKAFYVSDAHGIKSLTIGGVEQKIREGSLSVKAKLKGAKVCKVEATDIAGNKSAVLVYLK